MVMARDKIRVNSMKKIAFVLALCILASALIGCLDQKTQSEYERVLVTQVVGELPVNNLPILIITIDTDLHRCYCLDY